MKMSIGKLKQFSELDGGQWFVLPDEMSVGFVVQSTDEKRPVIFSSSSAKSVSKYSVKSVYIPEKIEITVDSLSLSEKSPQSGILIVASNGTFIQFSLDQSPLFANLATGARGKPDTPAIWFKKWSLLEKKPDGYARLLDYGS
jgi:hypothetical protein